MILKNLLLALCCAMLLADFSFAGAPNGRTIGVSCSGCHGPEGKSAGAIPSIYDLPARQIEAAMLAFRSGERPATIMNRIARGYSDNEIAAVSAYFANLK